MEKNHRCSTIPTAVLWETWCETHLAALGMQVPPRFFPLWAYSSNLFSYSTSSKSQPWCFLPLSLCWCNLPVVLCGNKISTFRLPLILFKSRGVPGRTLLFLSHLVCCLSPGISWMFLQYILPKKERSMDVSLASYHWIIGPARIVDVLNLDSSSQRLSHTSL